MTIVIAATLASYVLGWLIGLPWLVPFLNAAWPWWTMARELRAGRTRQAIIVMLVWAATMGVVSTAMAGLGWSRTRDGGDLFLRSSYRDEMIAWVRTGVGPESMPSVFVPRHLAYAAVFCAASVATAGTLSMPMGAVLMNQMGEYVGAMAAQSASPVSSVILGWHPWAITRVVGFVMIGVVLSGVLLSRLMKFPFSVGAERRWIAIGARLLVVDLMMKWLLAPEWGRALKELAGW
ncbi:MAG TPA: hypothetical protein VES67_05525 [Vicinamibacterales bacterium]|nr:hypothetical protein [Vicinamibacterales bacterium]